MGLNTGIVVVVDNSDFSSPGGEIPRFADSPHMPDLGDLAQRCTDFVQERLPGANVYVSAVLILEYGSPNEARIKLDLRKPTLLKEGGGYYEWSELDEALAVFAIRNLPCESISFYFNA